MAGETEFDRQKFEELIVYISKRLPPEAALGRVKLAKLLMLCDFTAYVRTGRPITGATYEKWEHGHLPREFFRIEKDLTADGSLNQEVVDYFGKQLTHTTAARDPHMAGFSEDELGIIEGVLRLYGFESASYLSFLSHAEPGWQLADEHEVIPYATALIGTERPPDSVFEAFRRIHGLAA